MDDRAIASVGSPAPFCGAMGGVLVVQLGSLPPPLNNAYATIGRRRVLISSARSWKAAAAWEIALAAKAQAWAVEKKEPLAVEAIFSAPDCGRWDLDGRIKLLLDAMTEAFGIDDRAIVELRLTKRRAPLGTVLTVWKGIAP